MVDIIISDTQKGHIACFNGIMMTIVENNSNKNAMRTQQIGCTHFFDSIELE